jgi:hypothetical protein
MIITEVVADPEEDVLLVDVVVAQWGEEEIVDLQVKGVPKLGMVGKSMLAI